MSDKNANLEATKEILRWLLSFLIGALLVGLQSQIDLVPEEYRSIAAFVIASAIRYYDKYKHESMKRETRLQGESMGLFPF